MSIRYVDRWEGSALNSNPRADCYSFRIDDAADYAALPTPTATGTVVEGSGTVTVLAGVGSDVLSQDQTIIGELQSDGAWHLLGGT